MNQKITRWKHSYYMYVVVWIKYFTWKKFFNVLLNLFECKIKKIKIRSVPLIGNIELSNLCILNCPLCPTGAKDKSQSKKIITFEEFKALFDKFKDYIFDIKLFNWGEPFLCPDIFKIVDYCHKNKVGVRLHSNFNHYDEKMLEDIVKCQVDYLHLSIDGYSQEAYEYYRVGGDIAKVFYGLEKIQAYKRQHKSKFPIIHWGYLINNRNRHEIKTAQDYAEKLKVEVFEAMDISLYTALDDTFKEENYQRFLSDVKAKSTCSSRTHHGYCKFLWLQNVINPDGSFCPCTLIYKNEDVFGSFNGPVDLKKVFNSEIFTESRKIFKYKNYQPKCFTPCSRCRSYEKP
ncbi:MAG: radical SAM protein [Patescibacteria group bacterium]